MKKLICAIVGHRYKEFCWLCRDRRFHFGIFKDHRYVGICERCGKDNTNA